MYSNQESPNTQYAVRNTESDPFPSPDHPLALIDALIEDAHAKFNILSGLIDDQFENDVPDLKTLIRLFRTYTRFFGYLDQLFKDRKALADELGFTPDIINIINQALEEMYEESNLDLQPATPNPQPATHNPQPTTQ